MALGLVACGDRRPPAAPEADAARSRVDGGPVGPGRPDAGPGRGDGGVFLPEADLEVVLPYRGPVVEQPLEATAELGSLDVHFSIDTTASFGEEIDAIQADLEDRIVPGIREKVADVAFGVSGFEDFPVEPFGFADDEAFVLRTAITTSLGLISSAVASLDSPLGNGGDIPESGFEALYQIATGEGYRSNGTTWIEPFAPRSLPGTGALGGVGFREGSLHVVVHVTDAPPHQPTDYGTALPNTHDLDDVVEAFDALDARFIGIASGSPARPHLEQLAAATGSSVPPEPAGCLTGIDGTPLTPVAERCPLVFDVRRDGTGLSQVIVEAIAELVNGVQFAEAYGVALDDRLRFVRAIRAERADPIDGVGGVDDRRPPADGIEDTFVEVRRGTQLTFVLELQNNTIPPAADYDQSFVITVELRGDDLVLTRRRVRIIVPQGRLDAGVGPILDGGLDAALPADASLDGSG